jgi:hypothetical protein
MEQGVCFAVTHVSSFGGPEGLLLEPGGLRKNFVKGLDENCVIVALLGQGKGKHSASTCCQPLQSPNPGSMSKVGCTERALLRIDQKIIYLKIALKRILVQ